MASIFSVAGFLQVLESWNYLGILLYLFKGLEMFLEFSRKKSMYSYKCIFSLGENTSHTLSAQGSFGLCYLTFKEAELIKGYR